MLQDAFGYVENENSSVNEAIRKHQRENLIRAIHLRSRLGYSTLSLQSKMEGAGRHRAACLLFTIAMRNSEETSITSHIIR